MASDHGRPAARCLKENPASPVIIDVSTSTEPAIDRTMIETNPIRARIADLQGRIASLRGYL
jgi:hypothetical protein